MMSFGPPGGNGTIRRIVLLGNVCAQASAGESRTKTLAVRHLSAYKLILPLLRSAAFGAAASEFFRAEIKPPRNRKEGRPRYSFGIEKSTAPESSAQLCASPLLVADKLATYVMQQSTGGTSDLGLPPIAQGHDRDAGDKRRACNGVGGELFLADLVLRGGIG